MLDRRTGRRRTSRARFPRGGEPAFDPATLSLDLWLRNFGGSPWEGTASAGDSEDNDVSQASPPAVGTPLNGHGTAEWTSDTLDGAAMSTYVTATDLYFWCVYNATSVPADPGAGSRRTGAGLFNDSGSAYIQATLHAAGFSFVVYDGGYKEATVLAGADTGVWNFAEAWITGGNMYARVNGGTVSTPVATTGPGGLTALLRMGVGSSSVSFAGDMAEFGMAKAALTSGERDSMLSYVRSQYGEDFT